MSYEIKVAKADSSLTIEFYPNNTYEIKFLAKIKSPRPLTTYLILMGFERIPTFKKFEIGKIVSHEEEDMVWKDEMGEGFFEWYIGTDKIGNRTGRWFMTVMALNIKPLEFCTLDNYNASECDKEYNATLDLTRDINIGLSKRTLNRKDVTGVMGNYYLRTYTSGCYFYSPDAKAWIADGTQVTLSNGQ